MDQKEDTKKTGPDQEQQTGQPATKPETVPARVCQICEGPNHHGCGCEARAAKEKSRIDLNALPKIHYAIDGRPFCNEAQRGAMQPGEKTTENENEATCQACRDLLTRDAEEMAEAAPEPTPDELTKAILSNETIAEARRMSIEQIENVKQINERIGALCDVGFDAIKFLQAIADDMITIRKTLCEVKQETEKPDQQETI